MGKTALITGAATRIGRAIATRLGSEGWNIAVHYFRSKAAAESLVDEIRNYGSQAIPVKADLGELDQVKNILPVVHDGLGKVDCLINNAAVFERDELKTLDISSWEAHLSVNLTAPLFLIQAMARELGGAAEGNVINIVDQRVWNLTPHFVSYTLSKSGLWTMTQTLALALAPRIRVNAIGPGPTLPSKRQSDANFKEQWKSLPLERPVSVDEIGQAVLYILGARSMTGQMIALDGGQHMSWSSNGRDDGRFE